MVRPESWTRVPVTPETWRPADEIENPLPPVIITPPVLNGSGLIGSAISVTSAVWSGSTSQSHVLQLDGVTIPDSVDAASYTPVVADFGKVLTVVSTALNGDQSAEATSNPVTVTVSALLILGTPDTSVPVNTAYAVQFSASGGAGSNVFSLFAGTLPTGLSLNPSTGLISGTPTVTGIATGLRVRVTDAVGQTATTDPFDINVSAIQVFFRPDFAEGVPANTPEGATIADLVANGLPNLVYTETGDSGDKFQVQGANIIVGPGLEPGTYLYSVQGVDAGSGDVYTATVDIPITAVAIEVNLVWTWDESYEGGVVPEGGSADDIAVITGAPQGWLAEITVNTGGGTPNFGLIQNPDQSFTLRVLQPLNYSGQSIHNLSVRVYDPVSGQDVTINNTVLVPPDAPLLERWVHPAGTGDGSSLSSPAPLSSLNAQISGTLPAGTVWLIAPAGQKYVTTGTINISTGGTTADPINIQGIAEDGITPAIAVIEGTRRKADGTRWVAPADPEEVTSVAGWAVGNNVFRFNSGTKNLTFRDIRFEHVAACFYCKAEIPQFTLENVYAYDVRRVIDNEEFSINGLVVTGSPGVKMVTGCSREAIRIRGNTRNVTITDYWIDNHRQAGDPYSWGIHMDGTVNNVIIRGSTPEVPMIIENGHDNAASGYLNSDGISAEGGIYNVTCENLILRGYTDSGIDTKCKNITLTNVLGDDNKRNFRIWTSSAPGDVTFENCESRNPNVRGTGTSGLIPTHFGFYSAQEIDCYLKDCTITDTDPTCRVFDGETSALILRHTGLVNNSDGTLYDLHEGTTLFEDVDTDDVTAPTFTSDLTHDIDEGEPFSFQLTTDDPDATFYKMSGAADIKVSRSGLVTVVAQSYNVLTAGGGSPILTAQIRARDANRNQTTQAFSLEINSVVGAGSGSVTTSGSYGWRWDKVDRGLAVANITLSGAERKTVTRAAGTGTVCVRGTMPFYAPCQSRVYWEVEVDALTTPASFAVGVANDTQGATGAFGANRHSIAYTAAGDIRYKGASIHTGATYIAGDRIGVRFYCGELNFDDPYQTPRFKCWFYKNGALQSPAEGHDLWEFWAPYFPAVWLYDGGDQATCKSRSTEWETAQTTFTEWGVQPKYSWTGTAAAFIREGGTGNGTSIDQPAPISQLNNLIAYVKNGSTTNPHVFLLADEQRIAMSSSTSITHGGTEAKPVTIMGLATDGVPQYCRFVGSRDAWTVPEDITQVTDAGDFSGNSMFSLAQSLGYLNWRFMAPSRMESTIATTRYATAINISDWILYGCRRGWIETTYVSDSNPPDYTEITDCTFERIIQNGFGKPCAMIRGTSHDLVFRNIHGNSHMTYGEGGIPALIQIDNRAYNVEMSDLWVARVNEVKTGTDQGDAIITNNGIHTVTFADCFFYDIADGAPDSKAGNQNGAYLRKWGTPGSQAAHFIRVMAYSPAIGGPTKTRSFRMWGDGVVLEDCVSYFEGDVGSRSHYIRGQGYRPHKTYIYRHKHYDSGSPVIGYEHPNACARFIDCEWIDLDNGNTSLPYNATNCILDLLDGDSNSSLLYGFSSDTSKPVYTGQTNVEVISGDKLNLALTADRPVSWEFASEGWTWSTDDQLYPLGYMCKDGFRLERFFSGGMAILRKWKGTLGGETATNDVAMVYDPEGDNEYTTAVVCESAAGVKSDPINITVTVSPLAANFPTFHEVTKTQNATAQTSHLVHMPPTVNAGDTLIMAVMIDGGPTVTWDHAAAGWTKLSSDGTSTEQRFFLYIKLSAVGNEDGATIDVTTNNAEPFAAQVARWSNVQDYVRVTGANSAGPNPGALTSPWGTDKNAWQLFVGANGSTTFAEPAGYSVMDRNTSGTSTSHVCVASTRKNDQKPTEDCPTLAISGNGPTSWAMICLRPQA